jgi:hypothetical protein
VVETVIRRYIHQALGHYLQDGLAECTDLQGMPVSRRAVSVTARDRNNVPLMDSLAHGWWTDKQYQSRSKFAYIFHLSAHKTSGISEGVGASRDTEI